MSNLMGKYYYNLGMLFSEVVRAHAQLPALRYASIEHSYSELQSWTEKLAKALLDNGLRPGDVIAIGHNKQPLSYALMLAAIKIGIVYVNVDIASPLARNSRILEVSGAKAVFYDDAEGAAAMTQLAEAGDCALVSLSYETLPEVSATDLARQLDLVTKVDGASIAYIMFTSGSTGTPKGVAVTHQNVLHFIAWGQSRFKITEEDNFANLSPMYFDNSVFDFYVALFSGASLSPVNRDLMTKPYDLVAYIGQMRCTIWFSVPSLLIYLMAMKAMNPQILSTLKHIVFGGEGYPKVELKKLHSLFSEQATLVNVYGPTECTCICSAYDLSEKDFAELQGLPPLGQLNQNFDYRILDEGDRDAVEGELCLIGPNVAAGYFNDLERSVASFITITEPGRFMKRMYRTGDLVRSEHGTLFFVGRKDNQIKHMGYRIELEEIEQALSKLAKVNQAAVVYHRTNSAYGKLIGFVASSFELDEKILLGALSEFLPNYMIPSSVIIMRDLPKNPNGKVDRHQLRALVAK
ncbi:D-alanine--poly(phosphoribitol) ligase subunit 1 [Rhizobium sp. BK181]|uniref:amino acid adenylation domain-containing protein n=1 Tax=Rhizobium sp. BK181 TaxID=2587072 RepID=UPI00161373EB|nr:amino acid adenylation domain-containing protein [Rhizobium sp. BK181]MBB3315495.1 D-alanine--poly(phosphoribitol) ligase subunit 1 [Rhizobium sp. BK181]